MSLEDTLNDLERRRTGFKERRDQIDEELAARRANMLAEEIALINDLIAKAHAQGATYGQIKKAYGTKDHRTITSIVRSHAAEVKYWKEALASGKYGEWFTLVDDGTAVEIQGIRFEIVPLDGGGIMLNTDVPRWNDDYTEENKVVSEFDAEVESENERVAEIGEAYRKLAGE